MKLNYVWLLGAVPLLVAAAPNTPKGGIIRPTTNTVVSHPTTAVGPARPVSNVVVTRPESKAVVVSHPSTAEAEAAVTAASAAPSAGGKNTKTAAGNTIPSGNSKTSMSNFQGKQAVDFKAAQTGNTSFDLGNGKPDSAKDGVAKNSDMFKGLGGNLDAAMQKTTSPVSKSKIAEKVKRK